MRKSARSALVVLGGFLLSEALYDVTHGDDRRLPEVAGIAAGCVLIDVAILWVFDDECCAMRSFYAQALVGLGTVVSRLLVGADE